MTARNRTGLAGLAVVVALVQAASAQLCGRWMANPVPGVRPDLTGVSMGVVEAATVWNPDGIEPAGERLVASGPFLVAGSQRVDRWAEFDGVEWRPFTPRPSGGHAHLLAVDEGRLLAGVGNDLLRLDNGWSKLGTVTPLPRETNFFRCTARIDGRLWVGGAFSAIDGRPAAGLAVWDGEEWHAVSGGPGPGTCVQTILAGVDGVFIGGYLQETAATLSKAQVWRWDGTTWTDLNVWPVTGGPSVVNTLVEHKGEILAGGSFGNRWNPPGGSIRRWDGSTWTTIISGGIDPVGPMTVDAQGITAYSTGLNGYPINRKTNQAIAHRYSGGVWRRLGDSSRGSVGGVVTFRGQSIAFGEFTGRVRFGLAQFDGEGWIGLGEGLTTPVLAMGIWKDRLVVAGEGVSVLEGSTWRALSGVPINAWLTAVSGLNDDLFVATGGYAPAVYRWSGAGWAGVTGVFSVQGETAPLQITCMCPMGSRLFVGGTFQGVGGIASAGLLSWNGTSWESVGGGLGAGTGLAQANALKVVGERLVVAGRFERAGTVQARNVAAWDGANWSDMSKGLPVDAVRDLTMHEGALVAVTSSFPGPRTWRWDGEEWRPLDTAGWSSSCALSRIRSIEGHLVGLCSGGPRVLRNGEWGTDAWANRVQATTMEVHDGRLYCGGTAGMALSSGWSAYLAEWAPEPNPPVPGSTGEVVATREGRDVEVVVPAAGASPMTVRWFKHDAEILAGRQPSGARAALGWQPPNPYAGLEGYTYLRFASVRRADAGLYTFEVSNACGNASGGPVKLEVACGGDFNADGTVSSSDMFDYLNAWLSRSYAADIDDYPALDFRDLLLYLAFYFEGCD